MSHSKPASFFTSAQPDLFQSLESQPVIGTANAPALNIGLELMGALNTAIREARCHGLGRERIVERMNRALPEQGKPLTKRQLDCWTAASKEFSHFPAEYLPAFCWATGSDAPLRVLAQALGYELVDARERAAKRLGEAHMEAVRAKREIAQLTKTLGAP